MYHRAAFASAALLTTNTAFAEEVEPQPVGFEWVPLATLEAESKASYEPPPIPRMGLLPCMDASK